VPREVITEEICLEAVRQDGAALQYVPRQLITQEMYKGAVKTFGAALQYIQKELKTEEVCLEAVKQNGYALQYVPRELITEEVCLEAVKQNGKAIQYVPREVITEEMCLEAVRQNANALQYVPREVITEEMCLEAVRQDINTLKYVPGELITEEMCLEGIKQNGESLLYVPESLKTEKIYLEAVKYGYALRYVPQEIITEEICIEAIRQNIDAYKCVPERLWTKAIYLEVVKQNGYLLRYVPEELVTEEMCLTSWGITSNNEESIDLLRMYHPRVLLNSGKEDEIIRTVEELIGDDQIEKEKLENIARFIEKDKRYAIELIKAFWEENTSTLFNGNYDLKNLGIILELSELPIELSTLVSNIEVFERESGEIPFFEVVDVWKNSPSEYKESEYKKLLSAGVIRDSGDYEEEYHKQWILKMYQVFGYENALRMLEEIPEISEEMLQTLIQENEEAYKEVFEKKYILTGEIGLSVEIINRINTLAGKKAFEIFKEINKVIESGEEVSITDILIKSGIEEKEAVRLEQEIKVELNRKKLNSIDEELRSKVSETVRHQAARIHDLIYKVLKETIEEGKEITKEDLLAKILEELQSKNETGEYVYSSVIRAEEENIKRAVERFLSDKNIENILNNSLIKILKRSKDKIGQGWIKKLIGIPLEMSEEEYKVACEKLGVTELEHEEEIKLKGKDEETKRRARELLKDIGCPELITFEKMEVMFGGLRPPYSKAFGEYFLKHKEEIMNNLEYIENFYRMHNSFERIINNPNIRLAYEQRRLEVRTVLDMSLNNKFIYGKGEAELAQKAKEGQLEGENWEDAREIFKITKEREESTIPPVRGEGKKFRGRMLRVDDPLHLFAGNITKCCQRFGDVGVGAMLHSATERNGGVFVIEEIEDGKVKKIVAQSWVWRNDDVLCFDNIEVDGDSLTYEEQEEVLEIYRAAGEQAIKTDMKELREMLRSGEITREQYEYYTLKEVRIGLGYNQGMRIMEEKITDGELEKSYDTVRPKEADKVYHTSTGEDSPWIDSETTVVIARNQEMRRVAKPEGEKGKEVPIGYRKIREIRELQGEEIDEDAVDIIREIEGEVYREEQIVMRDCATVEDIAEIYECEVEDLRVSVSRDKDWYAMYYSTEDSVYIADIALVNGANAQKKTERSSEVMISSIELAKKMYEILLEAAEAGKTVTCDATKDTSGLNIDNMVRNGLVRVVEDEEHSWDSGSNIQMRSVTMIPDVEKLKEELEKMEKLLEKAEDRRRVKRRPQNSGIGEGDR